MEPAELLAAFFAAVSFAPGGRPEYARLAGLFLDGATLIRAGGEAPEISTVGAFVAPRQAAVDAGELTAFQEVETAAVTEEFGDVAHRWSTYEKSGVRDGVAFHGRGLISTQFVRTGSGWRISTMAWDDERPGLTVPDRYLPGGG
jgi:hypothetical protein